ncbi:MAG TPA: tetratricopeptide repeat protein [Blastocatellia bacterium]|nr:tetratricopeptide repeat protein [Blastocatellia bacterium]
MTKKKKISYKEMRFRNDPMIRLYEKTQDWLQERGRPLVIAIAILAGGVVLYLAGDYYFQYRASKAQTAFAEAFEKYSAQVIETQTTTQVGKYYTDEKQKWTESAEAFEKLANEYPGYYKGMGRYYAGLSYLHIDPARGVQMLQEAIGSGDAEVADQARLALAEHYAATGDVDNARSNYEGLLASPTIPPQAVHFGLGKLYEASGETEKAVGAYFEAAKFDRETGQSSDAEKRLSALAPDRVKELPASAPSLPTP